MNWKKSKLYSISSFKCPRCHEGDMFPAGTLYSPTKFAKMYPHCQCCGQNFDPEPGYYFGAMFISYAISTALFIATWIGLTFLVEEVTLLMITIVIVLIVMGLLPVNFRLSRVLWIHLFIGYEGPCSQIRKK